MKYISLSILALLLLGGCASKPEPEPKPQPPVVVAVVEKPKPVVYQAPVKKGVVPPLPKREEDIDVDSVVDIAMGD